jgi:hypothetical protein
MNPTAHKFSAATIGGGVAAIICYLVELKFGITIPSTVGAGAAAVLTPFVSMLLPDSIEE